MFRRISSNARATVSIMAALTPNWERSLLSGLSRPNSFNDGFLNCYTMKLVKPYGAHIGLVPSLSRKSSGLRLEVPRNSLRITYQLTTPQVQNVGKTDFREDFFEQMKQRFLNFKKHKYLAELDHFRTLADIQSPKFMVIACADSRVCPSNILGFQPGEAFMIRNVANLVPPLENGPSETNAAVEFAVNTLEVEHILVVGHSSCAGIQALMSMEDDVGSSFVENWVVKGKVAQAKAKADAAHLSFDHQCRHCEKVSINQSLLNLLTYPWIEERVRKEMLSLHGGYYDFQSCTFEKWTLDFNGSSTEDGSFSVKDRVFWS
ncbi:beta carbonic anhydrase 5, chloroplastic-like isoform X1 [Tripterygium wilfordii]|uniref:beta carbonic anhydrase 5, chloroplastic-like isoform X1 n=1 Tax=Tripterygium wilfordii TaxID=458696 RepID=UPI0018F7E6FB|nr:beta carbonic anhydrase 5, chloroplastic-like isoform X1 [Tripterygium wilfordii]